MKTGSKALKINTQVIIHAERERKIDFFAIHLEEVSLVIGSGQGKQNKYPFMRNVRILKIKPNFQ